MLNALQPAWSRHSFHAQTIAIILGFQVIGFATIESADAQEAGTIRIGVIGLDTSHAIEFTKLLNNPEAAPPLDRCRVVCAFPPGSRDIQSSVSRVAGYTDQMRELDVEIVDSIDGLIAKVDAVMLESNDGRIHLEQILPVLKAHKPVFVDKPFAGSLADVLTIFEIAQRYDTPIFTSSSLRFTKNALAARRGELVGKVQGCDTFSPCTLETTHPDLYWYGIHGVEQLFTVMGTGCEIVSRSSTEQCDVVIGVWSDGRIGTFRGMRSKPHAYGGQVFGENGQQSTGGYEGYDGLVAEIAKFFASGEPPVPADETIEIYAFMSAADESKRTGGNPVKLETVLEAARGQMRQRIEELQ
jgi:predicted dehydrogenase